MRFNSIDFRNTININMKDGKEVANPKGSTTADKNWIADHVRHPYEWPRKQEYANYIRTGKFCGCCWYLKYTYVAGFMNEVNVKDNMYLTDRTVRSNRKTEPKTLDF